MDYNLADRIVGATIANIMIESQNEGIYLCEYNESKVGYKYFLEVAKIVRDVYKRPLYIEMPFFKFWKFKISNWKVNRGIKRFTKNSVLVNRMKTIHPEFYLKFMAREFDIDITFFDEIYGEYYSNENRSN